MSRKLLTFWLVFLPDAVLFYAGLFLAAFLRYGEVPTGHLLRVHLLAFTPLYFLWFVVFFVHGLFEPGSFRRYTSVVFNLVSAFFVNFLLSSIYFYFQPNLILTPRRFLILNLGIAFVLILAWHLIVKYLLKNRLAQNVYLFSFNNELADLEREIKNHAYMGFRVLGHLNENDLLQAEFAKDSWIILPDNVQAKPEVLKRFYELRKLGVGFVNHRSFYENLLRRVYLSQIDEIWFLENVNYKEKRFYNFLKRVIDLSVGVVGLLIFAATFPVVAMLIKLTSKGKIFIVQDRVGKMGEVFKVYKYRSMYVDEKNVWTQVSDKRITPVGRVLRKTRVDEWPQFINLILGNMSLVGPRPEQPGIAEKLKAQIPFYDERHLVKPGITGWAQLNVYAGSLEESILKLQYDFYYIKHRSLSLDVEIILKTLYYIFTWQGR